MMVEWVAFGLNTVVPILVGVVILLTLLLYTTAKTVLGRIPDKEEQMEMGYTLVKAIVDEKIEEFGLSSLKAGGGGSPGPASGRPGEGLVEKAMWFAQNTDIGRAIVGKLLGEATRGNNPSLSGGQEHFGR